MPLDLKLHRVHIEIGHFIGLKKGKLVPIGEIRTKFAAVHQATDALWTLIQQGVVVEDRKYKGNYQLTQEGAALIDEAYEELQAELKKKNGKVPWVPDDRRKDDRAERKDREQLEVDDPDAEKDKNGGKGDDKNKGGGPQVKVT